jgi:hypothetical protein
MLIDTVKSELLTVLSNKHNQINQTDDQQTSGSDSNSDKTYDFNK